MSLPVVVTLANPDPNAAPLTFGAAVNELRPLLTAEIDATITVFVKGSAVPSVDDQDKPWIRLDNVGRPAGIYIFYNGLWVKQPPDQGSLIGPFAGDPTLFFDGDGRGLVGVGPVAGDFYGWQIMNGNNGTANLSDKFIIGGRMDNVDITGYSGGWRTNVNGVPELTGGTNETTLDGTNTYRPAIAELKVGLWLADGNARDAAGALYGTVGDGSHPEATLINADAGNTTPDPFPTIPPFLALGWIQWIGYTYT